MGLSSFSIHFPYRNDHLGIFFPWRKPAISGYTNPISGWAMRLGWLPPGTGADLLDSEMSMGDPCHSGIFWVARSNHSWLSADPVGCLVLLGLMFVDVGVCENVNLSLANSKIHCSKRGMESGDFFRRKPWDTWIARMKWWPDLGGVETLGDSLGNSHEPQGLRHLFLTNHHRMCDFLWPPLFLVSPFYLWDDPSCLAYWHRNHQLPLNRALELPSLHKPDSLCLHLALALQVKIIILIISICTYNIYNYIYTLYI